MSMIHRRTAVLALLAATVAVQVGQAEAEDRHRRGREIAEAACSPCHATGRQGASPNAAAPAFRTLGQKYPIDSLEEALAEGILVGHPGMPQVRMSPEDIGAFLAWLKTIQADK